MPRYSRRSIGAALSAVAVISVAHPSRSLAQDTLIQEELYPLSAAIQQVEGIPLFIQSEASILLFPPTQIGLPSSVWLAPTSEVDGTRSAGKVFLASLVSTAAADLTGLYLLACAAASSGSRCGNAGIFALVGAVTIPVVGGAVGAKLTGARFGRAVFGSVAGLTAGIGAAALTGGVDDSLYLVVIPVVHAAVITVVTMSR